MDKAQDYRIVLVTIDSQDTAKKLSHALVTKKLAACVNLFPQIRSIYSWEDEIEETQEVLLLIKTKSHLLEKLEDLILDLHPYDCPEVISFSLDEGNGNYLNWLTDSCLKKD